MADVFFQIGVTTGTLVNLPDIISVSAPATWTGGTHVSLGGAQTVDRLSIKKTWTLDFGFLIDADYDAIAQYYDGRKGLGPFAFKDPRETGTRTVNVISLSNDSNKIGKRTGTIELVLQEV